MSLEKKKSTTTRKRSKQTIDFVRIESIDLFDITTQPHDIMIRCMSTPKILGLVNHLAGLGDTYLEIGTYQGIALCTAAHGNESTRCIGVDNFSWPVRSADSNRNKLKENISTYPNIEFIEGDFRRVLKQLAKRKIKVDTYFYDGPHGYEDQRDGLELALPLLKKSSYVIVDDANSKHVQRANKEFCREHGYEVVFERLTKKKTDSTWWNGITIMRKK